jgi:putative membrane protein
VLLGVFLVYAGLWAIRPVDLRAWALENLLTVLLLAWLIGSHRRLTFSNISYLLIFIFLCLHTIGAHYTYSLVPYDRWTEALIGRGLNDLFGWQRNHYDRLLHFLFGLLIAYPIRELFMRVARARGFWSYYLPLDVTISLSAFYELIEWAVAIVVGGDVGPTYLGTQGDPWDAHQDMALAALGALISISVVALINWKFDKNFSSQMRSSLTPRNVTLGERRLRRLIRGNRS